MRLANFYAEQAGYENFVEIEAYPDLPAPPSLRYWRQDQDGEWMMAGGCGRRVTSP